ncbi:hypothetical protein [Methanogenium cariaci]|uniref:hypothetical protein n=1 Tax=Methanogenium cariaci TaxID=2197 RepID=UPI0007817BE3|nr:hypothetical protein [Methanogenium cariaci]
MEAGTYPEKLTLNKPITLLGVGTPVVTTSEHGIGAEIYADSVTVAGFSFEGSEGAFGGASAFGGE